MYYSDNHCADMLCISFILLHHSSIPMLSLFPCFNFTIGCLLKDKGGPGAKELISSCSERTHVLQLDVTSEEEVQKAVKYISANLPNKSKGE